MIIVDDTEWLTVITQPDHARFAGELLSLWRTDGLPEHPRRQELLLAVREHDNGWQEADSAPWIDPQRHRPYDFVSYPEPARLEIWQRGILRFADQRPLVALLIAEHAEAIHQPLDDQWQQFFEELAPQRQTWHEKSGVDRPTIIEDYCFLRLADLLSLAVCARGEAAVEHSGIKAQVISDFLGVTPFPLAGTTSFEIPVRRIENRPYQSDAQIGSALARARWQHRQVKVGPFPHEDA